MTLLWMLVAILAVLGFVWCLRWLWLNTPSD